MIDISVHTVKSTDSIHIALEKLNLPHHSRTLFVVNEEGKVMGSITDGDIRRGLLNGFDFNAACSHVAFTHFKFLKKNFIDVEQLRSWRKNDILIIPVLNAQHELVEIIHLGKLKSYLPLTAVIMAGGFGQRLRPLTINTPKPMLKIGDLPILEINIKRLIAYGISDIYLCVNYLKDHIIDYFGNGSKWNCNIQYIEESEPLGTMGALSLLPQISTEQTLLFNADLLSNIDFEEFYLQHQKIQADLTIAGIPHKVTLPYAVLEQQGNKITSISEKPTYTYFSNAGFYLFKTSWLNKIPKHTFYNATDFAEALIAENKKVHSFPIHGYWNDIGSLEDYHKSIEDFQSIPFF